MSRRNECIKHAMNGTSPREIAAVTGLARITVYHYLCSARGEGMNIPKFKPPGRDPSTRSIVISTRAYNAFAYQAGLRSITAKVLVERILHTIAADKLVTAILDDAGDEHSTGTERNTK